MRKVLSIVMVLLLIGSVYHPAQKAEVIETQELQTKAVEAIETEEVHILTDEELSTLYSYKADVRKGNTQIVELDLSDANLLMKLAVSEAGDCGAESQYFVMMVILNRLKSDEFPNSIKEIVFQDNPRQFAVIDDGSFDKAVPNVDSHIALSWVEMGIDDSFGAIYFEASTNTDESWHCTNKDFLYEVGGQRYYK